MRRLAAALAVLKSLLVKWHVMPASTAQVGLEGEIIRVARGNMFETLEPPEQLVPRRWPLLMYGTYCVVGLVFVILGVRRHGLSQPIHLALSCVMFSLSLMWLAATLKSGTALTNRKARFRNAILLLLLMALNSLSLIRP